MLPTPGECCRGGQRNDDVPRRQVRTRDPLERVVGPELADGHDRHACSQRCVVPRRHGLTVGPECSAEILRKEDLFPGFPSFDGRLLAAAAPSVPVIPMDRGGVMSENSNRRTAAAGAALVAGAVALLVPTVLPNSDAGGEAL